MLFIYLMIKSCANPDRVATHVKNDKPGEPEFVIFSNRKVKLTDDVTPGTGRIVSGHHRVLSVTESCNSRRDSTEKGHGKLPDTRMETVYSLPVILVRILYPAISFFGLFQHY